MLMDMVNDIGIILEEQNENATLSTPEQELEKELSDKRKASDKTNRSQQKIIDARESEVKSLEDKFHKNGQTTVKLQDKIKEGLSSKEPEGFNPRPLAFTALSDKGSANNETPRFYEQFQSRKFRRPGFSHHMSYEIAYPTPFRCGR